MKGEVTFTLISVWCGVCVGQQDTGRERHIGAFDCIDLLVATEAAKYGEHPEREYENEHYDLGCAHRIIIHLSPPLSLS